MERIKTADDGLGEFTPQALETFRQMVKLEKRSRWAQWWKLHRVLHRELGAKPWQYPVIEYPSLEGSKPDTMAQARYRRLAEAAGIEVSLTLGNRARFRRATKPA
jgi:hypothetical protein